MVGVLMNAPETIALKARNFDRLINRIRDQVEPAIVWRDNDGTLESDSKRTPEWAIRMWELLSDDDQNEIADRAAEGRAG
jgi:hypothetical protein